MSEPLTTCLSFTEQDGIEKTNTKTSSTKMLKLISQTTQNARFSAVAVPGINIWIDRKKTYEHFLNRARCEWQVLQRQMLPKSLSPLWRRGQTDSHSFVNTDMVLLACAADKAGRPTLTPHMVFRLVDAGITFH